MSFSNRETVEEVYRRQIASQYFYGARTGGAIIMEGTIEICLGLFLADSIGQLFTAFPFAVLGAMLLFAGFELGRVASQIGDKKNIFVMLLIAIVPVITNIALGFLLGLLIYVFLQKLIKWQQESEERKK